MEGPAILYDARNDIANLFHVARYVTGDAKNAGRDAEKAAKAVGLSSEKKQIFGKGVKVLAGTSEEALSVARHLGASDEKLQHLSSYFEGQREAEDSSLRPQETLTLEAVKDLVVPCLQSEHPYPVVFDERWSSFMGQRHDNALMSIENLISKGCLVLDVHFIRETYRNVHVNRDLERFRFTRRGIKSVLMAARTEMGQRFREYYLDIEEEYNKVVPELLRTQEENERLRKELERAKGLNVWKMTRKEAIDMQKDTMKELSHLVKSLEDSKGAALYPICNNIMNQAVLDFEETTTAFKKSRGYHKSLSIPDVLGVSGQKERLHVMDKFLRFFETHLERLRLLPVSKIVGEVYDLGRAIGKTNTLAGDLKRGMLENDEALALKKQRIQEAKAPIQAAPPPPPVVINIDNRVINTFNGPGTANNNAAPIAPTAKTLYRYFQPVAK